MNETTCDTTFVERDECEEEVNVDPDLSGGACEDTDGDQAYTGLKSDTRKKRVVLRYNAQIIRGRESKLRTDK